MSKAPDDEGLNPYVANLSPNEPPIASYPSSHAQEGDATGGVIPYKNPSALAAYYLGLFSLLPCIGLLFAIPAFILGIMGLKARKRNPAIKGSVHAWIGIVMGGLMSIIWGGGLIFFGVVAATAG